MHAENPENFVAQARKFSPRSSGNRTGFSAEAENFRGRGARADPSVRQCRRLAERALHAPVLTYESHCGGPGPRPLSMPAPPAPRYAAAPVR
jgi:hypothetical protein